MGYIIEFLDRGIMTKKVVWTKLVLETFIVEGNLNERQEYIMRSRARGATIAEQALHLHLSIDQVNKDIAKLKKIYDETSKYCPVLPPRKKK